MGFSRRLIQTLGKSCSNSPTKTLRPKTISTSTKPARSIANAYAEDDDLQREFAELCFPNPPQNENKIVTEAQDDLDVFKRFESQVNSYGRSFPVSFERAEDCFMYSRNGKRYIDFLMGAGSLNYGHNNRFLTKVMKDYIDEKGVLQGLDMYTPAKEDFLRTLNEVILCPRNLDYKTQFTGPTGTNAVEAALKLARKATGRHNIVAFTNGYHGMSQGSLACTGNGKSRKGAGIPLSGVDRIPYCNYLSDVDDNSLDYFEKLLVDPSSGYDIPAAVLLETVQGEGGLNVASNTWLRRIEKICRKYDILLIVDDIQAGIGRTGTFFSFEPSGIKPNIVTLSKSLSASGLPMSVVLFDRDLDSFWSPGEHNGTFRGNNLAFSTATEALRRYWSTADFQDQVVRKAKYLKNQLENIADGYGDLFTLKGRGLMVGLSCKEPELAALIKDQCFNNQLVVETCGPRDEVVKFFPALTASEKIIGEAMEILRKSIEEVLEIS